MNNNIIKDTLYRPCVGIMIINNKKQLLVAERIDSPGSWQMPQGGIDQDETSAEEAMRRELYEEVGLKNEHIKIIANSLKSFYYDVPKEKIPAHWNGKFQGQKILFFLVNFIGKDSDIDLNSDLIEGVQPEFSRWKWSDIDIMLEESISFKRDIYQKAIEQFRKQDVL